MRFYNLVGRLLHPGAVVYFKIYNRITGRQRARVIVRNEFDEVLLVKTWIGHQQWSLPGGGVDRGETPAQAAQRELREETGMDVSLDEFRYLDTIRIHDYQAPIYEIVIAKDRLVMAAHDKREITQIGWYKTDNLPEVFPTIAEIIGKLAR